MVMDKEIVKAMATKFSEIFAIVCFKSIENLAGVARLIWMPHPLFKKCPDTYGTPCIVHCTINETCSFTLVLQESKIFDRIKYF